MSSIRRLFACVLLAGAGLSTQAGPFSAEALSAGARSLAVEPRSFAAEPRGVPLSIAGQPLDTLEQRLTRDPEDLRVGAEYRQLVIAQGTYDRAIKFLGTLTKHPGAGANAYLNLALAYVDKVPVSGTIRQAYLGRDAISALTRSISIAPSEVAYFIRGVVNLYYDRFIFHRTDKGVADLEEAKRLAATHPQVSYVSRVFVSLGDGYWRLGQPSRARQIWQEGMTRFPEVELLRDRINSSDEKLQGIIAHAFDANVRVDTSLRELFPDMPPPALQR